MKQCFHGNIYIVGENNSYNVGEKYWVTTRIFILRINKMGDYNINIEYEIHKDSKYSKTLESFTR